MNHFYRLVWNDLINAFVAVSELTKGRGKKTATTRRHTRSGAVGRGELANRIATPGTRFDAVRASPHPTWLLPLLIATTFAQAADPLSATALPSGAQLAAGQAVVAQTGARMDITQSTDRAILNWQSFNIGQSAHVNFVQPSAAAVTLNRVMGGDPSQILGRLTANGQVFLVNPNGIYFGKNAQIDVAGLVATTHNIRDQDFMAGRNDFTLPGKPGASVINEGEIRIADTGIAAFVAASVANRGVIAAKLGKIQLAAANGFTLDFHGDQLLSFLVDDKVARTALDHDGQALESFVESSGRIEAEGGYVWLTAKAAENAVHSAINHSGVIEANRVDQQGGVIVLSGGAGAVISTGTLDASSPLPPGEGPGVREPGSVPAQGGEISVNGGLVALAGKIKADGPQGGKITVQADHTLILAGDVSARGLEQQGGNVAYGSGDIALETTGSHTDVSGKTDGGVIRMEATGALRSTGHHIAQGETGKGGRIDLTGDTVSLQSAQMDASGNTQGGLVRIGGEFQGGKSLPPSPSGGGAGGEGSRTEATNTLLTESQLAGFLTRWGNLPSLAHARQTYLDTNTLIDVSARNGTGGSAVIWSDQETTHLGRIFAGGKLGGFVEISSAEYLRRANLLGVSGASNILLDPKNLTIGDVVSGGSESATWQVSVDEFQDGPFGGSSSYLVNISDAISGGFLYLDPSKIAATNYGMTYSLALPGYLNSGDNFKLELRVKIPGTVYGSFYTDLGMAYTRFNGFGTYGVSAAGFSTYGRGGFLVAQDGMNELLRLSTMYEHNITLNDWHTVTLETSNGHMRTYSDGMLLKDVTYSGSIGMVNRLDLHTWGSGNFDWIKAYNNGVMILEDNFDTTSVMVSNGSNATLATGQSFTSNPGGDVNVVAADVATHLSRGTNLILQANNDISVNSAIQVNNPAGKGGDLTLQAGRSISLNAKITTDNGNLSLIANETVANGTQAAYRMSGSAMIWQAANADIDAGAGDVSIRIKDGVGAADDILLGNITAHSISAINSGGNISNYSGGGVYVWGNLTASASSGTAIHLQANSVVAANNINSAINVSNQGDTSGEVTIQAGRSILLDGNITTNNGNVTLVANETVDYGTIAAYRTSYPAEITQSVTSNIDTGSGDVSILMKDGVGAARNISLGNISANKISAINASGDLIDLDSGGININGIMTAKAASGMAIYLQANNDIISDQAAAIRAVNSGDIAGDILMKSGRSILLNSRIVNNNGKITLIANEKPEFGTVNRYRKDGHASIIQDVAMAFIHAGTGEVNIRIRDGIGLTKQDGTPNNDSDRISLQGITAGKITVVNNGVSPTSGVVLNGKLSTPAATGTSIVIAAGKSFINNSVEVSPLDPGSGSWQVWSTNPDDDVRGTLAYDFKQYGAVYGRTALGQTTGSGMMYAHTPILSIDFSDEPIEKIYDKTTSAKPVSFFVTGTIDDDHVNLISMSRAYYDNSAVGDDKWVTVEGVTPIFAGRVYGYQIVSETIRKQVGKITPLDQDTPEKPGTDLTKPLEPIILCPPGGVICAGGIQIGLPKSEIPGAPFDPNALPPTGAGDEDGKSEGKSGPDPIDLAIDLDPNKSAEKPGETGSDPINPDNHEHINYNQYIKTFIKDETLSNILTITHNLFITSISNPTLKSYLGDNLTQIMKKSYDGAVRELANSAKFPEYIKGVPASVITDALFAIIAKEIKSEIKISNPYSSAITELGVDVVSSTLSTTLSSLLVAKVYTPSIVYLTVKTAFAVAVSQQAIEVSIKTIRELNTFDNELKNSNRSIANLCAQSAELADQAQQLRYEVAYNYNLSAEDKDHLESRAKIYQDISFNSIQQFVNDKTLGTKGLDNTDAIIMLSKIGKLKRHLDQGGTFDTLDYGTMQWFKKTANVQQLSKAKSIISSFTDIPPGFITDPIDDSIDSKYPG